MAEQEKEILEAEEAEETTNVADAEENATEQPTEEVNEETENKVEE